MASSNGRPRNVSGSTVNRRLGILVGVAVLFFACKDRGQARAEQPGQDQVEKRKTEVRDVLNRWLGSQNSGDFEGYAALYASDAKGIRRSGARTRKFDRSGWLADRKRMFRHPMLVQASDIDVEVQDSSATVEFTQTWKQGSYEDTGKKLLRLRKEASGWTIAYEEMLNSDLVSPNRTAVDKLRRVKERACACSNKDCESQAFDDYSKWLDLVKAAPDLVRNLTLHDKEEVVRLSNKAVECATSALGGLGDVPGPPSPRRCPKWFDRPDKWACYADCDEFCAGKF